MSTNHTTNYQLSQWEPEDKVLRTDFNADNAKIDTALAFLDVAAVNLAHQASYTALQNYVANHQIKQGRAMLCGDFTNPSMYTITGDAVIANGALTLTEAGKTATATTGRLALAGPRWHKAMLWVHHNVADVTASINGRAMTLKSADFTCSPVKKETVSELFFVLDSPEGESYGQVSLHLSCTRNPVTVYDWFAFFF